MAFELGKLKDKAVAKGLPEIEDLAEKMWEAVKEWALEEAPAAGAVPAALIPGFIMVVDPLVKGQVDKIDGQEG